MKSLAVFGDLHDFFNSCRVDHIAQMKQDYEILTLKGMNLQTQKPKLGSYVTSFLEISCDLLNRVDYYSQDSGIVALEWLSKVFQLLDTTEGIIKEGLGNLVTSESKSSWPFDFSAYTLLTILERTKITVQRYRVTLKNRYSLAREIRERTLLALTKMFFYFLMILVASIDVKEKREHPTKILEITSEALSEIQ